MHSNITASAKHWHFPNNQWKNKRSTLYHILQLYMISASILQRLVTLINSCERKPGVSYWLSTFKLPQYMFYVPICLLSGFWIPEWLQQFVKCWGPEFFNWGHTWQIDWPFPWSRTSWFIHLLKWEGEEDSINFPTEIHSSVSTVKNPSLLIVFNISVFWGLCNM